MSTPAPLVVPEDAEERPFADAWRRIVEVTTLYVPCPAPLAGQALLDFIDTAGATYEDGRRVGLVFTDRRLAKPGVALGALPAAQALARFYHHDRLDGLAFNTMDKLSTATAPGYVVHRFALPRIAGMAASPDPFAGQAPHAEHARRAVAADHVYQAYYHGAQAREAGAPLDSYYFAEMHALLRLGLGPQAQEYHRWYETQGGRDPRWSLVTAQLLTLTGRGDDALAALVTPLLEHAEHGAWAWRERGRALFATGRRREAVPAFVESLRRDPSAVETRMGVGIALRMLHWEPQNDDGLREALAHFDAVATAGDFHVPEALHHAGTIHLALGRFPELEALMRRTLALHPSPVSRRNLCLALHAQGKLDEARGVYEFLAVHFAEEAERLHKYFR